MAFAKSEGPVSPTLSGCWAYPDGTEVMSSLANASAAAVGGLVVGVRPEVVSAALVTEVVGAEVGFDVPPLHPPRTANAAMARLLAATPHIARLPDRL